LYSLKRKVLPMAAVLTIAMLASGHAPPDQYDTFNAQQTFIDDLHTKIRWQRVIDTAQTTQAGAISLCKASGQRLPTYRELLTIVDEDPHDEWDPEAGVGTSRYIDPDAFPGTPPAAFWSISPGSKLGEGKVVDFGHGYSTDQSTLSSSYYRCVTDL
jgi:hypothetical protein